LWHHAQFAVEFFFIAVSPQQIDLRIGGFQGGDAFAGKVSGEPVLPELVFPFDFAFGLGCGRIEEGDAVELESGA